MADTLRKVRPGEPLSIPASTFNTFVDAAKDFQQRQLRQGQGSQPRVRQNGVVLVKNNSGEDRQRFDVLGIDTPLFLPADAEDAFKNESALVGVMPTEADHAGKFVILLEPVADGELGLACVNGVCPVVVNVGDEGHQFADVYDNDATVLKSGTSGGAQILWKEEGTGEVWAVVRVGNRPQVSFPAKLTSEDDPGRYGWEEQGIDGAGDFTDIDNPRFGDGSGSEGDLGLAREFNDAEGLYADTPTVYVHMFEFTDAAGVKEYRFTFAPQAVRWGVMSEDWDVNACPNYVLVNPCDKGGGNPDPNTEVKVYLGWPESGHIAPYFWCLRAGALIPYVPLGKGQDGKPEGTSFRLWSNPVWGKATADWNDGDNFVMVRLTDEDGVEIGYTANVKCWLFSPESLHPKGVKIKAGDLLRIELPTYDPGTGVSFAHAINAYGGSQNKLLDGANHTDTAEANPLAGDIIVAHGAPPKWDRMAAGAQQSLLRVDNMGLPGWLGPGGAESLLRIDGMGNLAWKLHGNNESLFMTRNGQLDWLNPGNWDSILYNNAGTLDWLNPPWPPPALLMYDWLGLDWFGPGANEDLLITRNWTFNWLGKGAEQALFYVNNAQLDWFNPGLPQSLLITGQQGLAWKPPGLNESIFITRNGQLDWLGPGNWDSILYNNAGTLGWLNPPAPPALLMYDALGLAWFAPGANEDLLVTRNNTFAWLGKGLNPAILVTDNGTVQWSQGFDNTGEGAVLWIDPNGVFGWGQAYHALLDNAWHYDTANALPGKGAMIYMTADPPNGLWDALAIGGDQALLYVSNGLPAWLAASITVGDSLAIDANGKLAWQKFNLLDASHHQDTSGTGNLPGRGSMIVGAPALDGHICWQELTAGAPGAILYVDNNNDPTWLPKGQADQPLRCTADGLEWFDGPTDSITVVTDIQVSGVDVQKKTRQIDITKGLVCNIWPESDWVTVHTGTNCPTS